jgi:hypothetical protein
MLLLELIHPRAAGGVYKTAKIGSGIQASCLSCSLAAPMKAANT